MSYLYLKKELNVVSSVQFIFRKGLNVVSLLDKGLKVVSLFEERTQCCIFSSVYIQGRTQCCILLYKDSRSYLYLKKELFSSVYIQEKDSMLYPIRERTQCRISTLRKYSMSYLQFALEKGLNVVSPHSTTWCSLSDIFWRFI